MIFGDRRGTGKLRKNRLSTQRSPGGQVVLKAQVCWILPFMKGPQVKNIERVEIEKKDMGRVIDNLVFLGHNVWIMCGPE